MVNEVGEYCGECGGPILPWPHLVTRSLGAKLPLSMECGMWRWPPEVHLRGAQQAVYVALMALREEVPSE